MKIAVIVVAYKTAEGLLKRLKQNLAQAGLENYKLYFVDNTKQNIGFAAAVNKGIKKGLKNKASLFLILNPDIKIHRLENKEVINSLKRFDIFGGVFNQNKKTYYGGMIDPISMSGGLSSNKPEQKYVACDFVSGSLMFITKNTIKKIGLLEERFFLYYEDVEYCYRAKINRLRVGINTAILYEHFENSKKLLNKEYYLTRNRLLFLYKYGKTAQKVRELVKFIIFCLKYLFNKSVKNRFKMKGYFDFIKINKT